MVSHDIVFWELVWDYFVVIHQTPSLAFAIEIKLIMKFSIVKMKLFSLLNVFLRFTVQHTFRDINAGSCKPFCSFFLCFLNLNSFAIQFFSSSLIDRTFYWTSVLNAQVFLMNKFKFPAKPVPFLFVLLICIGSQRIKLFEFWSLPLIKFVQKCNIKLLGKKNHRVSKFFN